MRNAPDPGAFFYTGNLHFASEQVSIGVFSLLWLSADIRSSSKHRNENVANYSG